MFCILLGIIAQVFGSLAIGLCIACTLGSACDGVDVGLLSLYATMRLGRRTEDTETAEVEVEEVR